MLERFQIKAKNFLYQPILLMAKNLHGLLMVSLLSSEQKLDNLSGTYSGYNVSTDDIEAGYVSGRGLDDYPITFLKVGYVPYVFYLPHFAGVDDNGHTLLADSSGKGVSANRR